MRRQSGHYVLCTSSYQARNMHQLCGPMPNMMAVQPSIGGALCESSVIPFLVPHCKVWLTPAAGVPCSNAANIGERKTLMQSEFCTLQNSVGGKSPRKCIYSVSAQEMAKHRAKFGSRPLSNVGAVMKPTCETLEICWGAPSPPTCLSL